MDTAPRAFLLPAGETGARFCICWAPAEQVAVRGALLHVPAFGEEMNKSRRMVALAARALADAGYAVLRLDLHGSGDSDGELEEATWDRWLADLSLGVDWLRSQFDAPLWLWSLRAGALLASAFAATRSDIEGHLYWHPVLQGRSLLQQLLRLKATTAWASGNGAAVVERARAELASGRSVELAGYVLPAPLAASLEQASVVPPPGGPRTRLLWLEVSKEATLSPATGAALAPWEKAGATIRAAAATGPAFWQTLEIEESPALIQATVNGLLALEGSDSLSSPSVNASSAR